MLTKILVALHGMVKPKDTNKFFEVMTNLVLLLANILDVLVVIFMAAYVGKTWIVIYAVCASMILRMGMGEHYDTWLECLVSGLMIYTLYAFTSLVIDSLFSDLILGIILAVLMIDFRSEKAQRIFKRSGP